MLNLYMDLSEQARRYTQLYFNLHELYFDFTHLVCRTAIGECFSGSQICFPIIALRLGVLTFFGQK